MTFKDPEWSNLTQLDGERENALDILARLSLFDTLTERELTTVERLVHRRRFAEGEMIATPRSGLFIVASGGLQVVQHLPDGGRARLRILRKGEWIGEIVPLEDSPATSIFAVEQSEAIGFFRSDLADLLHTQPKIGFKIIYRLAQMMSRRMQRAMGELRNARPPAMKLENPITTTEEDIAR